MKLNGLKPVIQKRDEAVSPIIATILLVAITVILASTLYLALGGFFTAKTSATPTVALTATSSGTNTWTITIGSTSVNTISWSTTSWVVSFAGGTFTLTYDTSTPTTQPSGASISGPYWGNVTSTATPTAWITGISGTYVSSGIVLSLTISGANAGFTPTSIAFEDTSTTNGGQMGTASL